MPGFGYSSEFLLIFIVALLVFGPKRLPELAKSLGRAMHEFKRSMNEFKNQIETEVGADRIKEDLLRQVDFKASSPSSDGNTIETEEDYAKLADQEPAGQPGQAQRNKASFPGAPSEPVADNKTKAEPAPRSEDGSSEAGLPAPPKQVDLPPKKTDA